MNLERWPNGLGWDIDEAEVRDCVSFLRAFVPMADVAGEPFTYRRMDFPLGTDPIMAVMACAQDGKLFVDGV